MSLPSSSFFLDPCTDFPCKRGKTCKLDADNKPGCVCQQAPECPPSVNDFDRVSTDGDATGERWRRLASGLCPPCDRCAGRTTKRTSRHANSLPLNVTWREPSEDTDSTWTTPAHANVSAPLGLLSGSNLSSRHVSSSASHSLMRGRRAGAVPPADAGLAEERAAAALRARRHHLRLPHSQTALEGKTVPPRQENPQTLWVEAENVPSARFAQVKKIFESDRRLHAGNHSVELLAQDFEKNYNMYIYPVHWQFAQLDQHPSDRCVYNLLHLSSRPVT